MCGGHGFHHLISLAATEISAHADDRPRSGQDGNGASDIENEVRLMYARGEIGTEAFRRLYAMAQARDLTIQDVKAFQARAAGTPSPLESARPKADEFQLANAHLLEQQRTGLEAACAETEESIRRLQLEAAAHYQEAEVADIDPDAKADALSQAEAVERRIDEIRERLSHLKTYLADITTQQRSVRS